MRVGIEIDVDVTKIQKDRIKPGKNGKYLKLTMFLDTEKESKYGDHGMVLHSLTKEEREQGLKLPILGNGKVFYVAGNDGQPLEQRQQQGGQIPDDPDSIPF